MDKVLHYIEKNQLLKTGEKIVVGVSGGADSVCLLFLLKKYGPVFHTKLEVVHMEHGIRGKDSLEDAAFVENLCKEWDIPFHLYRRDIPALSKKWKCSEEEAGRRARYEAFEEVREKAGAEKIAVAHNMDDQAETILWNLVRGSGLRGMGGISPKRGRIIRPLLCLSRREIEGILKEEGLPHREDATNRELFYTRNKIRLKILPLLKEELNKKASEHMAMTAERLAYVEEYLSAEGKKRAGELAFQKDGCLYLNRKEFSKEPRALRDAILLECLALALNGFLPLEERENLQDLGAVHIESLEALALNQSGRSLDLPKGLTARTEGEFLILEKKRNAGKKEAFSRELVVPGETICGKRRFQTALIPYKNEIIPEKMYTKWFDYDKIQSTVQLRTRQSGDYLTVNSLGGTKTLKKYFIDEKVPAGERETICLLADGAHILWVVGRRISEAYKVTETTKIVLQVQMMEES